MQFEPMREMGKLLLIFGLVLAGLREALAARCDLLGQRLEIKGRLHPMHADRPPGLTVEQWSVAGGKKAF